MRHLTSLDRINKSPGSILSISIEITKRFQDKLNWFSEKILSKFASLWQISHTRSASKGSFLSFSNWATGIGTGIVAMLAGLVKMITGILGTGISSVISLLTSILIGRLSPACISIKLLLMTIIGGIISLASNTLILLARFIGLLSEGRQLHDEEKDILSEVFHSSLNLHNIRIAHFPFGNPYFFTLQDTIYTPNKDQSIPKHILVHEAVHNWQYHHEGIRYLAEAIAAQVEWGRENKPDNAYDWTGEIRRGKTHWETFNKEAAAQLIEEIWKEGSTCIYSNSGDVTLCEEGNGVFFNILNEINGGGNPIQPQFISGRDQQNYTALAIESMRTVHSKK